MTPTPAPVLILGGRSEIGLAVARRFAAGGHPLQLAARNVAALEDVGRELERSCGVPVTLHEFDALDIASHESFVNGLQPFPEVAVCAVGMLGGPAQAEHGPEGAIRVMRTNYEGPASVLALLAQRMEAHGAGVLVGISSVAGERGRASNYVYGSAKAGFTAFLSGLRNRLAGKGVHVVTVLPGFVRTRMVEGMELPRLLTALPDEVGEAVHRAVRRRQDVVYVRPVWRWIMLAVRAIPEVIFKRMRL